MADRIPLRKTIRKNSKTLVVNQIDGVEMNLFRLARQSIMVRFRNESCGPKEVNFKMDLQEVGWRARTGLIWLSWWALVNVIMNHPALQNGEFLD